MRKSNFLILLCGWLLVLPRLAIAGDTLDGVRAAGSLSCGIDAVTEDYSKFQSHGDLSALGRDVCRAVAAVTLGDADKVTLLGLPDDPHALAAVASGKIALLAVASPDLINAAAFGVAFGPPVFLDGQGFLVHTGIGIAAINDLANRQVCFISETQAEQDLNDRLVQRGVHALPFPFEESGEMQAALVTGHCAAVAAPVSALADMRTGFHGRKSQFEILPETITLRPVAPAYRPGDPQWGLLVTWAVHALILAEEAGVTQANAADMREHGRPQVRYLLGGVPGVGKPLGLDDGWAFRIVQSVGNYGEMFERDLGAGAPMRLARGRNALWVHGGLIYAPPIQ